MAKQLKGYELKTSGEIVRHKMEPEGSLIWGEEHKERGRPAWLQPAAMFRSTGSYFVLLDDREISPLIPGKRTPKRDMKVISRAAKEQASKNLYSAEGSKDPLVLRMTFALGFIVVAMVFAILTSLIAASKFLG